MNDPAPKLAETVLAPEGIELRFGTATAAERLIALAVDLVLLLLLAFVLAIPLGIVAGVPGVVLLLFALRYGYFAWFETRWNGRTPGKRLFHLRVIRADGGPLSTEVVLARNLTREVELFVPMIVIMAPAMLFPQHSGLVRLLATAWVLLLLFFPLTNRHRLRLGDLLAGTRVVVSPPQPLLRDFADHRESASAVATPRTDFRSEELEVYGEHELHVLEEVLRKASLEGGKDLVDAVTRSIHKRLGRGEVPSAPNEQRDFLQAFYRAQRAHLEQRRLLGRGRARKRMEPGGPAASPSRRSGRRGSPRER